MGDERYSTKVDPWLGIAVGAGLLAVVFAMAVDRQPATWIGGGVTLVAVASLCWPCHYTFAQDALLVRSGLIVWRVPYVRVRRAAPSRNLASSPAWSLDRVKIDYGSKFILVSPERQEEFLTELALRAGLKRMGSEQEWSRPAA